MLHKIESLNLQEWTKKLSLMALNRTNKVAAAAAELGVTERTLWHYIKRFNFINDGYGGKGQWYVAETKKQIA